LQFFLGNYSCLGVHKKSSDGYYLNYK
jgi:hypothetical protein